MSGSEPIDLSLDLGNYRYAVAFAVALALALYFTPIIRKAAFEYGVLDHPDDRLKKHKQPVPYLGGVAIYLAFLVGLAITWEGAFTGKVTGMLLSASIIVTIGLFDDLKVLTPGVKLLGQIVATLVLIKAGIMIELGFLPSWLALVLTIVWMVGVTNAVNLIDVSDGLAAGAAGIAGGFLYFIAKTDNESTIAMLAAPLVGAAFGFLHYNRPPAKIYMGDTGSMFLGFMLGALAMIGRYTEGAHRAAALAPIVILGVPIFDTLFVMGARAMRKLPILRGSPDHFAVRMRNNGYSAGRIAVIAYLASILLGLAGVAMCELPIAAAIGIFCGVVILGLIAAILLRRLGRGPAYEQKVA